MVGCQLDESVSSYSCCEYDIMVIPYIINKKNPFLSNYTKQYNIYDYHNDNLKKNDNSENTEDKIFLVREKEKLFEIHYLGDGFSKSFSMRNYFIDDFDIISNYHLDYFNHLYFPSHNQKKIKSNFFKKKVRQYRENFDLILRKKITINLFILTRLMRFLSRDRNIDETISSFYLKMTAIETLSLIIQFYTKSVVRPSHIKNQVNLIYENTQLKLREKISDLYNCMNIERANISNLKRSERSLRFLTQIHPNLYSESLFTKIKYFKENSMYVDAFLLINNYINDKKLNGEFIKNYKNLLNYIVDNQISENYSMIKETLTLIEINRDLLKGN